MSMLFRRKAILPIWVIVFGVFALFAQVTLATGVLLLTVGVVAPAVLLFLWKEAPPTVAKVLYDVEASPETKR